MVDQLECEPETNNLKYTFSLIFSLIVLASCENSESNIRNFINTENLAVEQLTNSEIIYTESGNLKVKVMSRKMERFLEKEEIIELSGDVQFDFYKLDSTNTRSVLTCEKATINSTTNIMISNNNVVLKDSGKKELKSEQLIWDKNKNLVYTESEITIQTEDEIISGVGFKSTPDFTEYEIKKAKGVFSLEK
ncbi:MAG: LPS export ABC transporter periplasmic protein LptC [Flavobacteriales bacterium]|nr:LPS export ABC transporter periplasmic protein LptC [Flavobacteriales bacterium]